MFIIWCKYLIIKTYFLFFSRIFCVWPTCTWMFGCCFWSSLHVWWDVRVVYIKREVRNKQYYNYLSIFIKERIQNVTSRSEWGRIRQFSSSLYFPDADRRVGNVRFRSKLLGSFLWLTYVLLGRDFFNLMTYPWKNTFSKGLK